MTSNVLYVIGFFVLVVTAALEWIGVKWYGIPEKAASPRCRRVCHNCKQPIKRHDRYHYEGSTVMHNECGKQA
ncbi:MAG: hypothetical protein KGL39_52740 [Patescibacteria group bacterium]|nr:hypothetical protein [Patescibacteria group bacterium]